MTTTVLYSQMESSTTQGNQEPLNVNLPSAAGGWPVSKHTIISSNPYIISLIRTHSKMGHSYRFFLYSIAYEYVIITRVFAVCLSELYCVVFIQAVSGCYAKVIAYYDPINWCITALFMSVFQKSQLGIQASGLHYIALYYMYIVLPIHCITCSMHQYYRTTIRFIIFKSKFRSEICHRSKYWANLVR